MSDSASLGLTFLRNAVGARTFYAHHRDIVLLLYPQQDNHSLWRNKAQDSELVAKCSHPVCPNEKEARYFTAQKRHLSLSLFPYYIQLVRLPIHGLILDMLSDKTKVMIVLTLAPSIRRFISERLRCISVFSSFISLHIQTNFRNTLVSLCDVRFYFALPVFALFLALPPTAVVCERK